MSELTKWIPRLIAGIALIHLAYALAMPYLREPLREMASEGVFDAVGVDVSRELAVWFVLAGISWLGVAELARWMVRETGRIPARLGVWLLAVALPLIIFVPASGGWLVAAIGALALWASRSTPRLTAPGDVPVLERAGYELVEER